ncbi:polygalacturonase [Helianthus annuus]|uniref:polygalacturonase n=1 Tax=Helianthus annuus TaxID=4232 RepID=UPI000B8F4C12|nr:polygalacturonase [Helianthus annuus]
MKNIVFLVIIALVSSSASSKVTYNVTSFGAKGDGNTDSTKAFLSAWSAACNSTKSAVIYVPTGTFLLATAITFAGERCQSSSITIRIYGTLVAPFNYAAIANSGDWIRFHRVNHVTISGGTLDARGGSLWSCKTSGKSCPSGATTLGIYNSKNIVISGLKSINSQMFHILLDACTNARLQGVSISASGASPNTDGIHLISSNGVTILNSKIATGDDCISIGPGNSNLWIQTVACGPGHGISIGSLGWELDEPGVQNITVTMATFRGTQNGVRIKTWARASHGFVTGALFQHVTMVNVSNPIIIEQRYCPDKNNCPNQVSGVKIKDVVYDDIHGTSATKVAVKLDCSQGNPCSGIRLKDVNLNYVRGNQPAVSSCAYAAGTASGISNPTSCL